jgi:phage regulator Rha-like protein
MQNKSINLVKLKSINKQKTPVTTSEIIADKTGNKHQNVIALIKKHEIVSTFKTEKVNSTGRPKKYALLTEESATLLCTMLSNTPQIIKFKKALVSEFFKMREHIQKIDGKEWQQLRTKSKKDRNMLTDAWQGSGVSKGYHYSNLTKAIKKTLEINPSTAKDELTIDELAMVDASETIQAVALRRMNNSELGYYGCKDVALIACNNVVSAIKQVEG